MHVEVCLLIDSEVTKVVCVLVGHHTIEFIIFLALVNDSNKIEYGDLTFHPVSQLEA